MCNFTAKQKHSTHMSTTNAPIRLTQQILDSAPSIKGMMELDAVQRNWIQTYEKTTGRPDGALRYEAEKILFMQAVSGNKQLAACSRFSIYASLVELGISGLTLRDGLTYIIPRKGQASFMIGWKGRLEQITQMDNVVYAHEPVVVFAKDVYEMELGMQPRVIKHVPSNLPLNERGPIIWVYFVIEFTYGPKVYFMSAAEVMQIRDNYSESWKSYVSKTNNGTWEAWMDKPMWVTAPEQAFKKTLVRRVYNNLPKLPRHEWIDTQIKARAASMGFGDDPEEIDASAQQAAAQQHDFASFVQVEGAVVDTQTGEVTDDAPFHSEEAQQQQPQHPQQQQPAEQQQQAQPAPATQEKPKRRAAANAKTPDSQQPSKTQFAATFKKQYETTEEVLAVLATAVDMVNVSALYYQNAEMVEATPHVKQAFAEKKAALNAKPAAQPQQQAAPADVTVATPEQQQAPAEDAAAYDDTF